MSDHYKTKNKTKSKMHKIATHFLKHQVQPLSIWVPVSFEIKIAKRKWRKMCTHNKKLHSKPTVCRSQDFVQKHGITTWTFACSFFPCTKRIRLTMSFASRVSFISKTLTEQWAMGSSSAKKICGHHLEVILPIEQACDGSGIILTWC